MVSADIELRERAPDGLRASPPATTGAKARAGTEAGPQTGPQTDVEIDPRTILVGIPTLNEAAHLEDCLRSLTEDDAWMRDVRIVVADGGSTDGTRAIAADLARRHPNLRVIDNARRLQSAALNETVVSTAEARHEVLVRCDAHSIYPPGFVRRVAMSLRVRGASSLVVPMDAVATTRFGRAAAWIADTKLGNGGAAHRGGRRSGEVDHGHHAGMRLDWFRRIGGYDPAFSHNEDAEYDVRLRKAGGRIWLDGDLRIAYVMRPGPIGLARQYWRYGQGRARTVIKHQNPPRVRQMIPVGNVAVVAGGVALAPVDGLFLVAPGVYVLLLAGVSLAAACRTRSLSHLWAGPALAAMHLPWGAGFLFGVLRHGGRQ